MPMNGSRPDSPRRTLSSASRVIRTEPGIAWFAPSGRVADDGQLRVVATQARRAEMIFRPQASEIGPQESWYLGGRSNLVEFEVDHRGGLVSPSPLLQQEELADEPGAELEFCGASSVVLEDGRTAMWFSARPVGGSWKIYRMVGTADGSWGRPQLTSLWGHKVRHALLPSVVHVRKRWWMWYVERDHSHRRICLATSHDGESWRRHGVVLDRGVDGDCDAYAADCPAVVPVGEEFLMLYGAGSSRSIAAARSSDGIRWTKLGPVVHRGDNGSPTSKYAFYPSVIPMDGGSAILLYAGESDQAEWSLLTAAEFRPTEMMERPKASASDAQVVSAWSAAFSQIGSLYLHPTTDAFGPAPAFHSADGQVHQIRPSSTGVFKVSAGRSETAVKVGRSRSAVAREYEFFRLLADHYPVPSATLMFHQTEPYLCLPWVSGPTMADLAQSAPDDFLDRLVSAARDIDTTIGRTIQTAVAGVDWPPQDHTLLQQWYEESAAVVMQLSAQRAGASPRDIQLEAVVARGRQAIAAPPAWVAIGSGDNHLHNMLVDGSGYQLIDLEFAGLLDIDYTVAKLVASCVKHTGVLELDLWSAGGPNLSTTSGVVGAPFLALAWWREHVPDERIRWDRVAAYVTAKMKFRLTEGGTGSARLITAQACAHLLESGVRA